MKNASRKWKERLNFKNEFLFVIYEKYWVVLFSFSFYSSCIYVEY